MQRCPQKGADMTTDTSTKAHFHCNDVVVTLGVGGWHDELVDELPRVALARTPERPRTLRGWLQHAAGRS